MESLNFLLELEEPVRRIRCGINALGIMTTGLSRIQDPHADGFAAIWDYLLDADQELQEQVSACLNAVSARK